jgi:hypothetical protein
MVTFDVLDTKARRWFRSGNGFSSLQNALQLVLEERQFPPDILSFLSLGKVNFQYAQLSHDGLYLVDGCT